MAITLPGTDPASWYYRKLEPGRAILIENTSRPWSVELTRWIARRKRIPAANIVSAALGDTSYYYDPGDNQGLWDNLLTAVYTSWAAVGGQGIYLGPGCPDMVVLTGQYGGSGSAESVVMLADLVAGVPIAKEYKDAYGVSSLLWHYTANGNYASLLATGAPVDLSVTTGYIMQMLTRSYGYPRSDFETQYVGANAETVFLPTQYSLDLLGDAGNARVLGGKFGVSWSRSAYTAGDGVPDEVQESADLAGQIVRSALRYGEAINPANRYQQRIHCQFDGYSTTYKSLCYLVDEMLGWGYDVDYFWRNAGDSETELYAPVAGSAYTLADLQAGRVKDRPYHVMVGDASNAEMNQEPFRSAWQPTPGGGSWLGPSEGWLYALNGLRRGGSAGASNGLHITTAVYQSAYALLHNLLRGMSWAEATYFSGYANQGAMVPVGDPTLTPFPRG